MSEQDQVAGVKVIGWMAIGLIAWVAFYIIGKGVVPWL